MVKAFCFLILWEKGWQQASSSNLLTPAVFHLMFFWAKGIWTWNFLTFDFKIVDSFFFILRIMPSSPPVLKLATRSSLKKSKYNLYCVKSFPKTEFFLVRIFLLLDSVFSPNAGKYVPEKTPYLDTFNAVFSRSALLCRDTSFKLSKFSAIAYDVNMTWAW